MLYRYVNLQKGGELVRIYEQYGQKELEDFIRKEIQPLLYNEGKGKVVEKADFVRWKRKHDAKVKVSAGIVLGVKRLRAKHEFWGVFAQTHRPTVGSRESPDSEAEAALHRAKMFQKRSQNKQSTV